LEEALANLGNTFNLRYLDPHFGINSLEDERIIREAIHAEIFTSRHYRGVSQSVKLKMLREANISIVQAADLGMKSNVNWLIASSETQICPKTPLSRPEVAVDGHISLVWIDYQRFQ
jgi:hypothetical protein